MGVKMTRTEIVNLDNFDAIITSGLIIADENGKKVLKMKDIRPSGSLLYADYTRFIDDLWDKTGGEYEKLGNIEISGGNLDLAYNDIRGLKYLIQKQENIKKGSIIFSYIPNYVYSGYYTEPREPGDPAEIDRDITIYSDGTDNYFSLKVTHKQDNNLYFEVYTDGGKIAALSFRFENEYNKEYIIEVTYDLTKAVDEVCLYLFIDGVSCITNQAEYGQKLIAKDFRKSFENIWVGNDYSQARYSNFKMNYLVVLNDILHTASYSVEDLYFPDKIYSLFPQYCDIDSYFSVKRIFSIYNYFYTAINSQIKIIVGFKDVSGVTFKYYDAVTQCWKNSNGSIDQANTFQEVEEVIRISVLDNAEITFKLILVSNDGYDTPIFESFMFDYLFFYKKTVEIHKTLVYIMFEGQNKNKCKIRAILNSNGIYKDIYEIAPEIYECLSDDDGYAEIFIPDTENMDETSYYIFTLYNNDILYKTVNLKVPAVQKIQFHQLDFS